MKTTGGLQERMRGYALPLGAATLVFMGLASFWTPFLDPVYFDRWVAWPTAVFSAIVPALVLLTAWVLYRGLTRNSDYSPFLASLLLFMLAYAGIGISFYPHIVPPALTIRDAAAPESSLGFALVGAAILLPIILIYTGYAYWVFRGKVDPEAGYH